MDSWVRKEYFLHHYNDVRCTYGVTLNAEICDKEMECYISDLCKQAKIRPEVKPQFKQLSMARREMLK